MLVSERKEYFSPDADEVSFDPTGSEFDPSIQDVGTALREIGNLDLKTLTEFEAFESEGLQSTTSNGWVTKSGYPLSIPDKTPGFFNFDFTIQARNSDKEKRIGTRFQYRQLDGGGSPIGAWLDLVDIRDGVSFDNVFQLRTGFSIVELDVGNTGFQVRWQFGQTDDGGTGSVQEANFKIGRVAETL